MQYLQLLTQLLQGRPSHTSLAQCLRQFKDKLQSGEVRQRGGRARERDEARGGEGGEVRRRVVRARGRRRQEGKKRAKQERGERGCYHKLATPGGPSRFKGKQSTAASCCLGHTFPQLSVDGSRPNADQKVHCRQLQNSDPLPTSRSRPVYSP